MEEILDEVIVSDSYNYGSFGERFIAVLVDGIIVGIPIAILQYLILSPESVLGQLSGLALQWLYFAVQESSEKQATLGKSMMGLRVVDNHGQRLSFGRATGRHFSKYISAMTLLIGYLIQPFTEKKQALHDMIASTLVIKE